jgi:hypothetical protein
MKVQSALLVMAMSFATIGACSMHSDTPGGMGGGSSGTQTAGTGGSSGGGQASCDDVMACGGSVVGTWTVSSSCLKLSGKLDIAAAGLDPRSCTNPTISGSLQVTGTWTANADGTYTDGTTTTGDAKVELPAGCLQISGTTTNCEGVNSPLSGVGFDSVNCQSAASGGCTCTVKIQHVGGVGLLVPDPQKNGNYTTSGNTLTADGMAPYSYCASANKLTVSPQSTNPGTTGTIVLESAATTGAGGAGGSAGGGGAGGAGGSGMGGAGGAGGGPIIGNTEGPCDIYAAANMPCVAAYSTVRRLNSKYTGPLYQVRNGSSSMNTGSGGMTKDIAMTADGYADTAAQDAFCNGSVCTFALLYDQSGNGNNLPVAKKGLSNGGAYSAMDDFESSATKGQIMVGGHKLYSLYMAAREGYRLQAKGKNVPLGSAAEGIYELADGTHSGTACCWDFGNVTTDPTKYATMNTLFFGSAFWGNGADPAPWFMADFEAGVWAGGSKVGDPGWGALNDPHPKNTNNPSMKVPLALGILKTSPSKYAIRAADTQKATDLTTAYEGAMPKPMDNQGGIVIGVGGDNSNNSWGTFYEGAIVAGYPTNETDLAVLKNVQAAAYGK